MAARDSSGLFVTGTDTGVGKTHVAAMIARTLKQQGRKVGVYKPAASGCRRRSDGKLACDDAVALWHAGGKPGELDRVCPQCFAAPLAPHLAARVEGRTLDAALLRSGLDCWRNSSDFVVVEGAGGLFSPLGDAELNADLAADFDYPLVIVTANRLGTIHATLATILAAQAYRKRLPIHGVILNDSTPDNTDDPSRDSNVDELRHQLARLDVPLLAAVRHGDEQFTCRISW